MSTAEVAGEPAANAIQDEQPPGSQVGRLVAPLRRTITVTCLLQGISSAVGVMPCIAVAEIGRVLLADVDFQFPLRRDMATQLSTVPLGWFNDRNAGAVKKAARGRQRILSCVRAGHRRRQDLRSGATLVSTVR